MVDERKLFNNFNTIINDMKEKIFKLIIKNAENMSLCNTLEKSEEMWSIREEIVR